MIKILFICHGNICRSPMAEFIMKDLVEKQGIKEQFLIESMATSNEEIYRGQGNPIYPPAKNILQKYAIGNTDYTNYNNKRAKQFKAEDYDSYDYILCADRMNISNLMRVIKRDSHNKVHLLLDYTSLKGQSIADPWYSDDFETTYKQIDMGCKAFLEYIKRERIR